MKAYYETELGKLYHGDCLEIMPELEPVDLVLKKGLINKTNNDTMRNEEKQERSVQDNSGKKIMGATESGNRVALLRTQVVNGTDGKLFQNFSGGNEQGFEATGNKVKGQGPERKRKRALQGRKIQPTLSDNDREGSVSEMQNDGKSLHTPQ